MSLPRFEYRSPSSLSEALAAAGGDAVIVAGGTELFVRLKDRIGTPNRVIGIGDIAELKGMDFLETGGLRIGAGTRLAELAEALGTHPRWRSLGDAVLLTSSPLLRNAGTVGGNLCQESRCYFYNQPPIFRKRWESCFKLGGDRCHVVKGGKECYAVYSGDLAGPLMALKATAVVAGMKGKKTVEVGDLFTGLGARPTSVEPGEILTEIALSALPAAAGFNYQKLRLRDTIDYPLMGISLLLEFAPAEPRTCLEARLVLSATGPAPVLIPEVGELLKGKPINEKLIEEAGELVRKKAHPVANTASTPKYRRDMVPVLVRRAFHQAAERAGRSI